MGRQNRVSFIDHTTKRDTKILDLVHSSVCSPINVKSLGGATCFVILLMMHKKTCGIYLLK